jgi:hypothetical protein
VTAVAVAVVGGGAETGGGAVAKLPYCNFKLL